MIYLEKNHSIISEKNQLKTKIKESEVIGDRLSLEN